jgi:hypothetical protein
MNNSADLNEDGKINIRDLHLLSIYWNRNYINEKGNLFEVNSDTLDYLIRNWDEPVEISDNNDNDNDNSNVVSNFIQNSGLNPGDEFYIMMATSNTTNLQNEDGTRNQNVDRYH